MSHAACTLFEGNYHLGAGALINSLHAAGFAGRIICGHRGPLPPWADAARRIRGPIEVRFVPVETDVHLTYHKPEFLRACWEWHHPGADQLYYFDPDIVVKAPWSVLARWAADGLALCEDVNGYLPARHPYRLGWIDFLQRHELPAVRPLDRYYNAGFIGLPRSCLGFIGSWARIIADARAELGALGRLKHDRPHALFHSADQDAMNMALMISHLPVNGAGPEGMDFIPGGHLLSHAAGSRKPWKGGFLRAALRGRPPAAAQKSFFRFADGPLPLFRDAELARLRLSLRAGALLGRVYRRA